MHTTSYALTKRLIRLLIVYFVNEILSYFTILISFLHVCAPNIGHGRMEMNNSCLYHSGFVLTYCNFFIHLKKRRAHSLCACALCPMYFCACYECSEYLYLSKFGICMNSAVGDAIFHGKRKWYQKFYTFILMPNMNYVTRQHCSSSYGLRE